jgi:hypothetical protein
VELFPVVLDVEVESDVAFPEVLHLEEGGIDVAVEVVKDEHLP